jgi:predicted RNase H-like HicB family nuclease
MLIETYPVGMALDVGKAEPFLAYLIDLPGVAMQGRSANEAREKLKAIVPAVLATYRKEGTVLPPASPEPSLTIGRVRWADTSGAARPSSPQVVEIAPSIELSTV